MGVAMVADRDHGADHGAARILDMESAAVGGRK
jgi:hypothetical protein